MADERDEKGRRISEYMNAESWNRRGVMQKHSDRQVEQSCKDAYDGETPDALGFVFQYHFTA